MAKVPVEARPGSGFSDEVEGLFVNVLSVGWNGIEPHAYSASRGL
jgi:hypothetical protein